MIRRRLRRRPLALALSVALLAVTPLGVLAKPVPRATVTAAESMMAGARKEAEKGRFDKALQQADKAIELVSKVGGPDAPELVALRSMQAEVASLANDAEASRAAALDGARIALAGPPHAPGVEAIEATLEGMASASAGQPDPAAHEIARTYASLLEHEGVSGQRLGDAYKLVATTTADPREEAEAFGRRVKAVEADKGAASAEAASARLDSADVLAAEARARAGKDAAGAALRVGAAEGLIAPIDASKLPAASKRSFVSTLEAVESAFLALHPGTPALAAEDADHVIAALERGLASLGPLGPETSVAYANLHGEEALAFAASDRVAEARDHYLKALEALDPKHGASSERPTFLDGLRAFIDTPIAGAVAAPRCRPAGTAGATGARSKLAPRCADMAMVRELARVGAAAAVAAKLGSEHDFDRPLGVAACADNDGRTAAQMLGAASDAETRPSPDEEYDRARILVMCDVGAAEKHLVAAIAGDPSPRSIAEVTAFATKVWERTGEVHRVVRVGRALTAHAKEIDPSGKLLVAASLAVGSALSRMHDAADAEPLLEAALAQGDAGQSGADGAKPAPDPRRAPDLYAAHVGLARVALLSGDLAKGAAELELALDQADAGGASPDDALRLLVTLARIDRDRHDAPGLAKVSARALALAGAPGERAERLAEIGRILEDGDATAARSYYEALLARSSTGPSVLIAAARLSSREGDHQAARSMLEDAYSQDPKNTELDCVLMGELTATGEPGAANMLRDKLVREVDPTNPAAPRSVGCVIDSLSRSGHLADADAIVQRVFDAEAKVASANGAVAILTPLEAAWAYRAAGDGDRASKWGALYQRALDGAALQGAKVDTERDLAKAFARDHAIPSLVELEAGMKSPSKAALAAALDAALRWHARGDAPITEGSAADEPKDLVAAVRERLPADGALLQIVRVAPIAADASKAGVEALDAIGPAADVRREAAQYVAYVLPKRGEPRVYQVGDARAVDDEIHRYVAALSSPRSDPGDLGRKLFDAIVAPAEEAASSARELIVVPDGDVALLPIGALSGSNHQPLMFRRAVSYLPSARTLLRAGEAHVAASPAAPSGANEVFAAPDLTKGDGQSPAVGPFGALKIPDGSGTRAAGDAWSKAIGSKTYAHGEAADEAALKSVSAPATLLLATHGFVVARDEKLATALARLGQLDGEAEGPSAMMTAGLALAGAKAGGRSGEDGLLTAREAEKLDLRGTKLVVLTPFDVGLASPNAAEGLTAVRRAFFDAGAETVVTSLWQSDPDVTASLLVHFQKNLARGVGRADALRLAQATIAADVRTRHPYYWAGFAAFGATTPIASGKQTSAQHDIDALQVHWGGCGCEVASGDARGGWLFAAALFGAALLRRRKRSVTPKSGRCCP